jgi:hypothetical protein
LVLGLLLACAAASRAGEADDEYIGIYKIIREADSLNDAGQLTQAQAKYTEARGALQAFHRANPDWNVMAVNYRLDYLASRITAIAVRAPAAGKPGPAAAPEASPAGGASAPAGSAPPPADWANQIDTLKSQERQWQAEKRQLQMDKEQWLAEKGLLEAKLKEALTIQPAAADPRELAKAEQRIKTLQKEKDLLSVSLEQAKEEKAAAPAAAPPPAKAAAPAAAPAPAAPAAPSADAQRLKAVERERDELAKKLEAADKALAARNAKTSRKEAQAEINNLRAKLEALEAHKTPYSPEELALLKTSEPAASAPSAARKSVREIPAGMAALVARARSYFFSKQYEKAEELYLLFAGPARGREECGRAVGPGLHRGEAQPAGQGREAPQKRARGRARRPLHADDPGSVASDAEAV